MNELIEKIEGALEKKCRVPDCYRGGKISRGLCKRHYTRLMEKGDETWTRLSQSTLNWTTTGWRIVTTVNAICLSIGTTAARKLLFR